MLYGLYLSATGVMTSSYRQDVIANNLANEESIGFKKDLALFKQRSTAAMEHPEHASWTNPLLESIGGGTFAMPTSIDTTAGIIEHTGSGLDSAIQGPGFFSVSANGQDRLTRNGQFQIDRDGFMTLSDGSGAKVLDPNRNPILLDAASRDRTFISQDGVITQNQVAVGRVGMFDVPDPTKLKKEGGSLMGYPDMAALQPSTSLLRNESIERSNVDPTTEMAALMETQRQLEANATMIKYQDQTLAALVNTVGKIG